ncbi:SPOR domain-containing protein [Pontibacter vulgaris]|uniref:HU domain-containing protein n=1 Tax=Pontibacter vulgaris TaxID=2905679 RepID=UPI001FA8047A|nr:SPOR domain-containing protein [Pontibacter vulgaris]
MVEKHIKSLLYDHDCVIIPDFGGLIARYVSARIYPVKHTIVPPSRRIAFNEKLVLNDGLLISSIAYHKNISQEEAQRLVSSFVHQAKNQLDTENRFELPEIGVFKYNAERKLVFEYVEADNLLEASFGLPELTLRPIKAEEPAVLRTLLKDRNIAPVATKQPLRKRLKRIYNVAAALALSGIVGSVFYLLSLQNDYNLSSLNPMSFFGTSTNIGDRVVSRYTSNFIPLTEEERATVYEAIIPAYTPVAEVTEEAWAEGGEQFADSTSENESITSDSLAEGFGVQEVEQVKEAVAPVAETKSEALIIKEKTGRFYIITGGYARLHNAEINRDDIINKGQKAVVLEPVRGSRLFRVAVADFATEEEAKAALKDYRKTFGETIWVLNN